MMEAYQERVIEERDQLRGRLTRLESFLKPPVSLHRVSNNEVARLTIQLHIMQEYADILDARIKAFNDSPA